MKQTLFIFTADFGTAFFIGDELINYVHENDGDWREEYFNPIIERLGYQVKALVKLNKKQQKQVDEYEQ